MRQAHKLVLARAAALAGILLTACNCAFGLNPALEISQYAHTVWKTRRTNSIVQTPDGYLWIGTDFGLFRFDGVRTVEWVQLDKKQLPSNDIRKLLVSRDGRLWIGTSNGLASWKDGELLEYPELAGSPVLAILEDSKGTTWAGQTAATAGRLCAIQSGKIQCYGQDGRFGQGVPCLYEYKGSVWAGAANGLWRWKPGSPERYSVPDSAPDLHDLIEGDDGALWIANRGGMERLVDRKVEGYALAVRGQLNPSRLLRDREGGLWIGTYGQGLIHIHQGNTDVFTSADGLSADFVNGLFEDREGNIWVATLDGFDSFRDVPVADVSFKQELSGVVVYSVLPASDGSVWLATSDGLKWWKSGQLTVYRKPGGSSPGRAPSRPLQQTAVREIQDDGLPDNAVGSLFQDGRGRVWVSTVRGLAYFQDGKFVPVGSVPGDVVHAITEDRGGTLWIANQNLGLFGVSRNNQVHQLPWPVLGGNDFATALATDPVKGGLWVGFRRGGVVYFADGQVRASYPPAAGFGEGAINDLHLDRNGTLWVATDKGLGRLKNGRAAALTRKNGLPCDAAHWVIEDDANSLWLSMACGLVRVARADLEAWTRSLDDPAGNAGATRTIHATVFDSSDGVKLRTNASAFSPHVSKSPDGKLWSAFLNDVNVIDPHHLPANALPPPVHIERIVADDKPYPLRPGMRLPANVRNLRIEYIALSLVAPEKIRFKYMLEGQNTNWHEVINERVATYTNLPPRNYRFRVIASNNSGVWNETGDTLEFSIAPAYYQTNWFRAMVAATLLAMMAAVYLRRVWRVQQESRRLRDVIETIPAYVWSAQPDGSVDFINRRWLEFSGYTLDHAKGWGWTDALHPEDRARLVEGWRAAVVSGNDFEAEARMRGTDGQYSWLLFRSVPQRDRLGKIVKWYGKSMDITELKRAEEERERLHELEADLAHMNRVSMMGELSASIAHELNQPLTGIVSNGSACLRWLGADGPIPAPAADDVRDAVRDMVRDGKRAGEIIKRIRTLTKRTELPGETLDLNETIREVLALVADEAKKNSVTVGTQFADEVSPVHGDRVQLQQVLLNLLMNAIQAMSSVSDRARQLVIATRNIDQHVQVTVEDSGTGLDPEKIAKIFEPFYTTKSGGMGMGLSICRSIVQNHGGRLWATVNEGPGATFHFTLPKHRPEEQDTGAAAG